jgi:plasmid stabilization system protein ParE
MKPLRYEKQFATDLAQAIGWYIENAPAHVDRLRRRIELTLDSIAFAPESFQLLDAHKRAALVTSFPLLIVFSEEVETILIVRLLHAASNWQK